MSEVKKSAATQKTPVTESAVTESKAPLDPKELKKQARKAAKKVLASWVASPKLVELKLPVDVVNSLTALFGQSVGGGGGGVSLADKIAEFFSKTEIGKGVDELELFRAFKIGRGEMRKKVRALIRDNAPEDRLWIDFDAAAEEWIVKGKGPKAPAGWKGYLPTEGEGK